MINKIDWSFRIGLFLLAFAWFSFNFYELTMGIFSFVKPSRSTWPIVVENVPGVWGLGLRTAAGLIAVIAILFYLGKQDLSKPEAMMALRMIIILEAASFLCLSPGWIWRLALRGTVSQILEAILPTFIESIAIPAVLIKVFLELSPKKPAQGAIKWSLIAGTVYVFVYWFTNATNWIGAVYAKGVDYVILHPINMLSFLVTVVGLFALTLYVAYFSKRSVGKESLTKFDLKRVGLIITAVGLYFNLIYVLWLFFGSVGGWGSWYAWFLGHGNLWSLALPLVGLPLLFSASGSGEYVKLRFSKAVVSSLKRTRLAFFLFLAQGIGTVFYTVFSAAYILAVPSTTVLTGVPIFRLLLCAFGGLFFVFILLALALSAVIKQEA
jgi:hypothetical protein